MAKRKVDSAAKNSNGSVLKRLKSSLKSVGLIGNGITKKSKKRSSDRRDIKEKLSELNTKENPFEIKINRKKHEVLGQRIKGSSGKPTISRQKGNENVSDILPFLGFFKSSEEKNAIG